jgi:hypothetical protein
MQRSIPIAGEEFGTWRVLDEPVRIAVACSSCGARRRIRLDQLTSSAPGVCQGCGAGHTREDREGASATKLYRTWRSMLRRCSPAAGEHDRSHYYERGIRVCAPWQAWEPFRDWALAAGFRDELTIERNDVNGDYEPGNCRWIPGKQQAVNTRLTVRVTAFGETRPLVEWAEDPRCVVDYFVAYDRVRAGWEPELALTKPKRRRVDNRDPSDTVRTRRLPNSGR